MPKQKEWEIRAYYPNERQWKMVKTETDRKLAAQRLDWYIQNEPFTMFQLHFMGEVER